MTDLLTRLASLRSHHEAHRELALSQNIAALVGSSGFTVEEAVDFARRLPSPAVKAHDTALETILAATELARKSLSVGSRIAAMEIERETGSVLSVVMVTNDTHEERTVEFHEPFPVAVFRVQGKARNPKTTKKTTPRKKARR